MAVKVTRDAIAAMERAAKAEHPSEACGILLGETGGAITQLIQTRNVAPDPQAHFEIDPQVLIGAHRNARSGGLQILGYFHSHPAGAPKPSVTDQALAARDGLVWAIVGKGSIGFFRSGTDGFEELCLTVIDS